MVGMPTGHDASAPTGRSPVTQLETERTYRLPDGWNVPELAGVGAVRRVGEPVLFTQAATYLDTPDLALLRVRHTVRRRVGGVDEGWHLKSPGDGDSRREHHASLGSSAARVPAELRALIADLVGTAPLLPVAVLKTVRSCRLLTDADGGTVAELVDDQVKATVMARTDPDGAQRVLRWREVELELGPAGSLTDFEVLSARLEASGLTRSPSPSKLGRALAAPLAHVLRNLEDEGSPARCGTDLADPMDDATVGQVVLDYLGAQLGMLQAREAGVRVDAPDAVHQTRVATRRARSALKTFRGLFDGDLTDQVREELKWLASGLGAARDAEVLHERLAAALDQLEAEAEAEAGGRGRALRRQHVDAARRRLLGLVEADHREGQARSVAALDSRRYERLLAAFTDLLLHPPYAPRTHGTQGGPCAARHADVLAARALPSYLGSVGPTVTRAMDRAGAADAAGRGAALHEVRKGAKAARYAGEVAAPVLGMDVAASAAWKRVQDALGAVQDGALAAAVIGRGVAAARTSGEDTYVYGLLSERERAAAQAAEADAVSGLDNALRGVFAT